MIRRIAITLAGITAAGFLAAGTASATTTHGEAGGGFVAAEQGAFEYTNLGGPWGITHASGEYGGFLAGHGHGHFG
ncbi:hypothetical protein [Streptomyces tsukubensis]|uniref:Uncharacterized protein n=1 Tax=Streptomyces tsukubensis TaxID=83656 RepID=A0A1V4A3D6_9ACTN|nr:hypothetical protein [Streptomyces tsukubensis]OON74914.1 hypothetical protein B1H18_24120 [Streptomyces tsukubensis]QFR94773.1 hypothetical protein GBW32_19190 [Streptomyces tsukubensis]